MQACPIRYNATDERIPGHAANLNWLNETIALLCLSDPCDWRAIPGNAEPCQPGKLTPVFICVLIAARPMPHPRTSELTPP
jgi:hypothetical protein